MKSAYNFKGIYMLQECILATDLDVRWYNGKCMEIPYHIMGRVLMVKCFCENLCNMYKILFLLLYATL